MRHVEEARPAHPDHMSLKGLPLWERPKCPRGRADSWFVWPLISCRLDPIFISPEASQNKRGHFRLEGSHRRSQVRCQSDGVNLERAILEGILNLRIDLSKNV